MFGQLQPILIGPHLDVVGGHFGLQEHQDVVVVGALRVEIRVGRFDGPAEPSPEIQLPCGVEADRHVVVIMSQVEQIEGIAVSQGVAGIAAAGPLLLRKQIAGGDSAFGPGFQNAATGRLERQVFADSRRHQIIQSRIVEDRPPTGIVHLQAFHPGIVGVNPVLGRRGTGSAVVWADFEAIAIPLPKTAAHPAIRGNVARRSWRQPKTNARAYTPPMRGSRRTSETVRNTQKVVHDDPPQGVSVRRRNPCTQ